MLEKLSPFRYEVKYLSGSQNRVADFLSQHPQQSQEAPTFPFQRASVMVRSVKAGICVREEASFWKVAEGGDKCDTQRQLIDATKNERVSWI